MTARLTLLLRVVQRRMEDGEGLRTVLKDYPKLTEEERQTLQKALKKAR